MDSFFSLTRPSIHLFNKQLLSTQYVTGSILGTDPYLKDLHEKEHNRSDECPVICGYLDMLVFKRLCYNGFTVISVQTNSFLDLYQKSCLC